MFRKSFMTEYCYRGKYEQLDADLDWARFDTAFREIAAAERFTGTREELTAMSLTMSDLMRQAPENEESMLRARDAMGEV